MQRVWVITEPVSKRFFDLSIPGRFWKAWEIVAGWKWEIKDPLEAVKMAGGIVAQTQRSMESESRAAQELWTEEKLVNCRTEQILERVSEHFQSDGANRTQAGNLFGLYSTL